MRFHGFWPSIGSKHKNVSSPPGTYQPSTGQCSCIDCRPGFYCEDFLSGGETLCPAHSYCPQGRLSRVGWSFPFQLSWSFCNTLPAVCSLYQIILWKDFISFTTVNIYVYSVWCILAAWFDSIQLIYLQTDSWHDRLVTYITPRQSIIASGRPSQRSTLFRCCSAKKRLTLRCCDVTFNFQALHIWPTAAAPQPMLTQTFTIPH